MIDRRALSKLPSTPGVYFFRRGREILYIGKASSLRERVRSYFNQDLPATRGPVLAKIVADATRVTYQETDSVLEALILESSLIKRYQPVGNVREKDDKSFWSVVFTREDYPRVLAVRGRAIGSDQARGVYRADAVFGPFPHASELRAALQIIRRIFPFRDRCRPESGRLCFNATIGLCPGVCAGQMSISAYRAQIARIKKIFSGHKQDVIQGLKTAMNRAARQEDFEAAARYRNQAAALRHVADVSMIRNEPASSSGYRIEAYDVSHSLGEAAVGGLIVLNDGEPSPADFRRFRLRRSARSGDVAALTELLERRLEHQDWPWPAMVVVDGGRAQATAAHRVLASFGLEAAVVNVVKDERHQPARLEGTRELVNAHEREILLANRLVHDFVLRYHRRLRRKRL